MAIEHPRNLGYLSQSKLFYICSAYSSHFKKRKLVNKALLKLYRGLLTFFSLIIDVLNYFLCDIELNLSVAFACKHNDTQLTQLIGRQIGSPSKEKLCFLNFTKAKIDEVKEAMLGK